MPASTGLQSDTPQMSFAERHAKIREISLRLFGPTFYKGVLDAIASYPEEKRRRQEFLASLPGESSL